jgi:sarcosine oxidase, subunit alpha
MSRRNPKQAGEWINRTKVINFTFEGEAFAAFEGDTISSALWAAGQKVLGRSFKYHRPRGVLSFANHDVNILMTDGLDTNMRADVLQVQEGMNLHVVNTIGGVKKDKNRIIDVLSPFLPVGFYYKAFHKPRWLFPFWEKMIRKAAGLGVTNFDYPRITKRKLHTHCDLLVVGAGATGLSAAYEAASAGLDVILIDENKQAGGSLSYDRGGDKIGVEHLEYLLKKVAIFPNITLKTGAYAAGYYPDHLIPIVEAGGITKIRAKAVIVASGAFEQPPVFRFNDLPGVMLGSAAQRLIYRYSVKPFNKGIVFTANDYGYRVALDLLEAGSEVLAIVDLRSGVNTGLHAVELTKRGVKIHAGHCVYEALATSDKSSVRGAVICAYDDKNNVAQTENSFTIDCDGISISAGWAPAAALLYQAGTGMQFDNALQQFVPNRLPDGIFAAGKVNGVFELDQRLRDGERAANEVLHYLGNVSAKNGVEKHSGNAPSHAYPPSHPYPIVPHPKGKNFVDFDEDIQIKDFENAAKEGFDNIELMKRFTTVGMGPSQGKHSNMNAIRILAKIRGLPVEKIGTTTSRPFFHPTPIGHLAGRGFHPHRLTSLHAWHAAHGGEFTDVGAWKRAAYYLQAGQSKDGAIQEEALAVRKTAGMIDASSFGKVEVHGADAAEFLERFFTGKYTSQKVGACRYVLLLDESGVVIDDGIASRLADDLFYLSIGTGNAALVYREMQRCQQMWQLDIGLVNVTGAFGAINLAGPNARAILAQLTDLDLSVDAFPISQVRETEVAGVPARVIRAAFVSDVSYELHIAMQDAPQVWNALLEAGKAHDLRPFGIEAQRLLRLEMGHFMPGVDTDGLTNPLEIGAEWALKLDKAYFIGQRSLNILSKRPLKKLLVPFTLDANFAGELPLECNLVIEGKDITGRVTSISFSKYIGCFIGLAFVNPAKKEEGSKFQIRTDNGSLVMATVVKTPFFTHEKDV